LTRPDAAETPQTPPGLLFPFFNSPSASARKALLFLQW